jgi:hypothetical protein
VVLGKMWKSVFDIPVMMDDLNSFRTELQKILQDWDLRFIDSTFHPRLLMKPGMIDIRSGGMQ